MVFHIKADLHGRRGLASVSRGSDGSGTHLHREEEVPVSCIKDLLGTAFCIEVWCQSFKRIRVYIFQHRGKDRCGHIRYRDNRERFALLAAFLRVLCTVATAFKEELSSLIINSLAEKLQGKSTVHHALCLGDEHLASFASFLIVQAERASNPSALTRCSNDTWQHDAKERQSRKLVAKHQHRHEATTAKHKSL